MIITIGGEYGCGGKRIAEKAAELLGYTLCDDQLVLDAVKHSKTDLEAEVFRYFDESQGSASARELSMLSSAQANLHIAVTSLAADTLPLDRRMAQIQNKLFHDLAGKGSCIFLGRCADHYLQDCPDRISIFIIDDPVIRVRRVMEHFQIDEPSAAKLVRKTDKRRRDYYAFFTGKPGATWATTIWFSGAVCWASTAPPSFWVRSPRPRPRPFEPSFLLSPVLCSAPSRYGRARSVLFPWRSNIRPLSGSFVAFSLVFWGKTVYNRWTMKFALAILSGRRAHSPPSSGKEGHHHEAAIRQG